MAADAAQIMRQLGHAETAVHIHQRRCVFAAGSANVKIRNFHAIGRFRPKLLYCYARRVKLLGLAAQYAQFVDLQIQRKQRERSHKIAGGQIQYIAAPRLVGHFQRTARQFGHGLCLPTAVLPFPHHQAAGNFIQNTGNHKALGGFHAFNRLGVVRFQQQFRRAQHAFIQLHRHQRTGRISLVGALPATAQLYQ